MPIQSIVFNKRYYTITSARAYLRRKGYRADCKVDIKAHTLRFRQLPPKFSRYITKKKGGVLYVIGIN